MFAYTKIMQGIQAVSTAVTDAYFNLVTLLLPGNGTNGAQNNTFLDSSSNNFSITRNGNTTQGTFSPFSQTGWSNYFNGSSTISFASNSALNILAYDTFECWVNLSALGTNTLIGGRDAAYWLGYNHTGIGGSANKFVFAVYNGTSWQAVSSTTTPVVGSWYHVLGVKDNTTLRLYVNGVQENTTTFSGSAASGGALYVASNNNSENITGYVSNMRLVTGASNTVFPYSGLTTGSSFTVPTAALTAVTGTALLTCQSNRFVDNSTNAFAVTVTGTPSVQAFSPFAPTAAYDSSVVGGSGYFDGSGDYLTMASNAALAPGTGDFTIEAWLYPTAALSTYNSVYETATTNGLLFGKITSGYGVRSAGTADLISSTAPAINQWVHVAASRSGTDLRLFINGELKSTVTNSTNFATGSISLGASGSGTNPFPGYISGLRFVKGTALYTATFTVPTSPPTAVSNTNFLGNFTNAGITDATAKNDLETVGNAQISTTQSKFGGSSMYFDTSSNTYLRYPLTNTYIQGTEAFTVEGWIYLSNVTANATKGIVFGVGSNSFALRVGQSYLGNVNGLNISKSGVGDLDYCSYTFSANTWYHFAVCRSGTTIYFFVNGTQQTTLGSGAGSFSFTRPTVVNVGANDSGAELFAGYIDDLRITKGYARYTANFTAPTAAFPVQ